MQRNKEHLLTSVGLQSALQCSHRASKWTNIEHTKAKIRDFLRIDALEHAVTVKQLNLCDHKQQRVFDDIANTNETVLVFELKNRW